MRKELKEIFLSIAAPSVVGIVWFLGALGIAFLMTPDKDPIQPLENKTEVEE